MQKEDTGSGHEWTINEINMVSTDMDGMVQMPAVAFSTNLVEGTHLVDSSIKSTLLIGLDKNFFEGGDDARDVIFVDNSVDAQIKIHGADKSFLSAGNYVISFVDSGKESSWDTNVLESIKFKEDEEVTAGTSGGVGRPIGEATIMGIVKEPKSDQIFHMPDCFPEKQSTLINADLGCPSFSNDPPVPEESLPLKKKAKMKGPELSNFGMDRPVWEDDD